MPSWREISGTGIRNVIGTLSRTSTGLPSTLTGSYSHCFTASTAASSSPGIERTTSTRGHLAVLVDGQVQDHDAAQAAGLRVGRIHRLDHLGPLGDRHAGFAGDERLLLRLAGGGERAGEREHGERSHEVQLNPPRAACLARPLP
jgi:hypothetical protein